MAHEVVMPQLGLSMDSGRIVKWLRQEGEWVGPGTILLEVESDKATVDVESPAGGLLQIIRGAGDDEIRVGDVIAYLLREGEEHQTPDGGAPPAGDIEEARRNVLADARVSEGDMAVAVPESTYPPRAHSSPRARRRSREIGVDWHSAKGTGVGGRVKERDVLNLARQSLSPDTRARRDVRTVGVPENGLADSYQERTADNAGPLTPALPAEAVGRSEMGLPSRWQEIMAERMTQSFTTTPHFYLHVDVNARELVALRGTLLPMMEDRYSVHVSYTDLLVRFCSLTLARHPGMLIYWTEEGLKRFGGVNVAVAIDTPRGLVAPVIRAAASGTLADISRQRADLAERARAGKLVPRDLEEGSFTLSNLGMFRVDSFNAIINPPQAAILAVGRIADRPTSEGGRIALAPSVSLSLTVDHRVMDGATAARFLGDLVEVIEKPAIAVGW
jgi:pyruvate dehydrogenase E2 component (dihydrolipoamide acetyltransferase)